MFGKKHRDDDLKSTGWVKWANKFFRFVLFPFIHPIAFVVLIVVLLVVGICVPLYYGVPLESIPNWYMQRVRGYYSHTENVVEENILAPVKEKVADIQNSVGYDITVKTVEKKPSKKDMVAYDSPQSVNRKLFEQAQEVPVDIKATIEKRVSQDYQENIQFKPINGLGLSYLKTPEEQFGKAIVISPNEVMIDGKVMFLYGIYTLPSSMEGREAVRYLKETIEGKEINCWIGAYTQENIPAAICFYNDISINQRLIDLKFAKNVGLN